MDDQVVLADQISKFVSSGDANALQNYLNNTLGGKPVKGSWNPQQEAKFGIVLKTTLCLLSSKLEEASSFNSQAWLSIQILFDCLGNFWMQFASPALQQVSLQRKRKRNEDDVNYVILDVQELDDSVISLEEEAGSDLSTKVSHLPLLLSDQLLRIQRELFEKLSALERFRSIHSKILKTAIKWFWQVLEISRSGTFQSPLLEDLLSLYLSMNASKSPNISNAIIHAGELISKNPKHFKSLLFALCNVWVLIGFKKREKVKLPLSLSNFLLTLIFRFSEIFTDSEGKSMVKVISNQSALEESVALQDSSFKNFWKTLCFESPFLLDSPWYTKDVLFKNLNRMSTAIKSICNDEIAMAKIWLEENLFELTFKLSSNWISKVQSDCLELWFKFLWSIVTSFGASEDKMWIVRNSGRLLDDKLANMTFSSIWIKCSCRACPFLTSTPSYVKAINEILNSSVAIKRPEVSITCLSLLLDHVKYLEQLPEDIPSAAAFRDLLKSFSRMFHWLLSDLFAKSDSEFPDITCIKALRLLKKVYSVLDECGWKKHLVVICPNNWSFLFPRYPITVDAFWNLEEHPFTEMKRSNFSLVKEYCETLYVWTQDSLTRSIWLEGNLVVHLVLLWFSFSEPYLSKTILKECKQKEKGTLNVLLTELLHRLGSKLWKIAAFNEHLLTCLYLAISQFVSAFDHTLNYQQQGVARNYLGIIQGIMSVGMGNCHISSFPSDWLRVKVLLERDLYTFIGLIKAMNFDTSDVKLSEKSFEILCTDLAWIFKRVPVLSLSFYANWADGIFIKNRAFSEDFGLLLCNSMIKHLCSEDNLDEWFSDLLYIQHRWNLDSWITESPLPIRVYCDLGCPVEDQNVMIGAQKEKLKELMRELLTVWEEDAAVEKELFYLIHFSWKRFKFLNPALLRAELSESTHSNLIDQCQSSVAKDSFIYLKLDDLEEPVKFEMSKAIKSPFFRDIINGPWKEKDFPVIPISGVDSKVVNFLFQHAFNHLSSPEDCSLSTLYQVVCLCDRWILPNEAEYFTGEFQRKLQALKAQGKLLQELVQVLYVLSPSPTLKVDFSTLSTLMDNFSDLTGYIDDTQSAWLRLRNFYRRFLLY